MNCRKHLHLSWNIRQFSIKVILPINACTVLSSWLQHRQVTHAIPSSSLPSVCLSVFLGLHLTRWIGIQNYCYSFLSPFQTWWLQIYPHSVCMLSFVNNSQEEFIIVTPYKSSHTIQKKKPCLLFLTVG